MKKYQSFLTENFQLLEGKFSIYMNRRIFVMFAVYICYQDLFLKTWPRYHVFHL